MNYSKIIVTTLCLVIHLPIIAQHKEYSKDYDFINSVYRNHVIKELSFYYLYFEPTSGHLDKTLQDSLSSYLSDEDIQFVKKQFDTHDNSFVWMQDLLLKLLVCFGQVDIFYRFVYDY